MYNAQGDLTEVCHKSFSKDFCKETIWDQDKSYAQYKRTSPQDGGMDAFKNGKVIDNSWVVPYNPYLSLRYNAHLNVEIV